MKYREKEPPMTLKRRKELLEGLADVAEAMGIYDRKSEVPVETVKKDIPKSGIKMVCERYGITYTECPYAKGQFFDDMYNLRRLIKSDKSDEVILLCKKALRKIEVISYHAQKDEISNLNRTLISMLK
jgi:hypothetical protein